MMSEIFILKCILSIIIHYLTSETTLVTKYKDKE